ncbi:MAG: TonB family protein [Fibrobacter sp.]|nr:TonB family protein [Fibrobacter sp.]
MARLFSKCLGKIVLMTAAALWAGCNDSEKADDTTKQDDSVLVQLQNVKKRVDEKPEVKDSSILNEASVTLYGCNGCSFFLVKKSRDSLKRPSKNKGAVQPLVKNQITIAKGSALGRDSVFAGLEKRTQALRHIYNKYLKQNPEHFFEGTMILKIKLLADGSVKECQIVLSTTNNKEFEKDVRIAVSHWTFPKVESGETVATFPITFQENTVEIKASQPE